MADSEATIEITHESAVGTKLRSNKGINLPDSNLSIASLTPKDLEDLEVVAEQADIVGMSFVRSPGDVEALESQLGRLGRPDMGLLSRSKRARHSTISRCWCLLRCVVRQRA